MDITDAAVLIVFISSAANLLVVFTVLRFWRQK